MCYFGIFTALLPAISLITKLDVKMCLEKYQNIIELHIPVMF